MSSIEKWPTYSILTIQKTMIKLVYCVGNFHSIMIFPLSLRRQFGDYDYAFIVLMNA